MTSVFIVAPAKAGPSAFSMLKRKALDPGLRRDDG